MAVAPQPLCSPAEPQRIQGSPLFWWDAGTGSIPAGLSSGQGCTAIRGGQGGRGCATQDGFSRRLPEMPSALGCSDHRHDPLSISSTK